MVSGQVEARSGGTGTAGIGLSPPTWAYEPYPTQASFHCDIRTFYKGYSGPVGSGKSKALAYEALFLARMNPGLTGIIGVPVYQTLRDATLPTMMEALEQERIAHDWAKSEKKITLRDCGSNIVFRSLEKFENLRGPNLAWVGIDELTYARPEAWQRLAARVRHPDARRLCMFACWTPNGHDWVYRDFIDKPKPGYHAHIAKPRENYRMAGLYDRLAADYDERLYRQEALGEYLNVQAGQIYHGFDRTGNVSAQRFDPGKPLLWSLDFNLTPMSSVLAQMEESTSIYNRERKVRVLAEISIPQSQIWEVFNVFLRKTEHWVRQAGGMQVHIYGDATGNGGHHTGPSCYAALRQCFAAHPEFRMQMKVPSANPGIVDRINAVNGLLCNSERVRRCQIDPHCVHLIEDLEQTVWKVDSEKQPTGQESQTGGHSHMSSALGYLIASEFPLRQKGGPRATSPLFN